jgi:hypothetical protein
MTNDTSFGQRIAIVWRALVEHLNDTTRRQLASNEPHQTSGEEEQTNAN